MSRQQTKPTYGQYIGAGDEKVLMPLLDKYSKVLNPIVMTNIVDNNQVYMYEESVDAITLDSLPESRLGNVSALLNFDNKSFECSDETNFPMSEIMSYDQTYDFIQNSSVAIDYRTVDIDYLWERLSGWKMIETTTFFVDFDDIATARRIVATMNRRPSWQGTTGAYAWKILTVFAHDINAEAYVVCMNSKSKWDYSIKDESNAYVFPLTIENIDRISSGRCPLNDRLINYQSFIEWL